jgi:WD40 repeat protein
MESVRTEGNGSGRQHRASHERPTRATAAVGLKYNGFISYSHALDGALAPALQRGLHQFAKPWYRIRAVRVFRDDEDLSANPQLWDSIVQALDSSDFFVLLASPAAGGSKWVAKEVTHWCTHRAKDKFLIVLTEGEIVWDETQGDFDWATTTALPPCLRGVFDREPRWIDVRWAREKEQLSLSDARFKASVAEIAAPLHGRDKAELIGEDARQHRRTRRLATAAIVGLALLSLATATGAVVAVNQRDEAQAQARVATSRAMASAATAQLDSNYSGALLLAAGALGVQDTPQARGSLLTTLQANPEHARFLHGTAGTVGALTWSPSGNGVASGTVDGQVGLWDVEADGGFRQLRAGPSSAVTALRFSPDGTLLAVGSEDGSIEIWDSPSGQRRLSPVAAPERVDVLRFGPDGRVLAWSSGGNIGVWDLIAGREIGRSEIGTGISHLVFRNEGRTLMVVDYDGSMTPVDPGTARATGPAGPINVLGMPFVTAFAEDASFVAMANATSHILVQDVARGDTFGEGFDGPGSIDEMVFSPDGSVLAVGGSGVVELWDPKAETLISRLTGYPELVLALEFSPDGKAIAASTGSSVVVSDLFRQHRLGQAVSEPKEVANVVRGTAKASFSTDGKRLTFIDVTQLNQMAEVTWDVARARELDRRPVRDDPLKREEPPAARGEDVTTWADSADRKLIAVGHSSGQVTLHDAATGNETRRLRPASPAIDLRGGVVHQLEFSRDGRMLAVASSNEVALWALDTAQQVARFPTGQASGIALSPDGRTLAAISPDGVITVFDVPGKQRLGVLRQPIAQPAGVDLEFSPDGRLLASAVSGGGVMVWDMDAQSWRSRACQLAGRSLNPLEIEQFAGERFRKAASCG